MIQKTLAVVATCAALLATNAHAQKWDMPMAYPASNYHSVNGANFAKCVAKGTDGKLEIVTHPSGSLFKGNDIKRAVQTGQAPIGERLLSAHQNENILFGIDSVPFLATSFEESEALWSVARSKIEEILAQQNLVYLYAVPWPPQGLYFKKEISAAADMKGVKFRSYNTATARLATLAGMRPVQIEAAELSQALATGVAEAFITSAATGYDGKVWEYVSHFYMVDAWMPRNTVFVNKQAWEALDESAQAVVKLCADKAAAEGLQAAKAYNKLTVEGLRKGGMKIELPADRLRTDLKKIGEAMAKEWLSQSGDAGSAILAAYRKQ